METKKNARLDLHKMSGLFLSISFAISILLAITAFEWRQANERVVDLTSSRMNLFDELLDVPVTEIKQPPAPVPVPNIVLIPTEEEPENKAPIFDIDNQEPFEVVLITSIPVEPEEDDTDVPFILVQESATPVGGMEAFYAYILNQMRGKYPAQARRMQIEGRVFVEFIIEKDGRLSGVRAIKGIGAGCDELAVNVVTAAPRWNPGKQRGKPVRQRYTLPITFKLN